uniref:Uncharacterized protein n=1 Tax=Aegilops tauschii subsp. strangulata TaxID=200361 RepID=A0A453RZZ1_AEGTS
GHERETARSAGSLGFPRNSSHSGLSLCNHSPRSAKNERRNKAMAVVAWIYGRNRIGVRGLERVDWEVTLALMVGRLLARSPSRACCFSSSSCGGGGLVVGSGGSGRKGGALGGYKKRNPRKVASRIWA